LLTIEHMAMFVVKAIHIQINGQVMDLSIKQAPDLGAGDVKLYMHAGPVSSLVQLPIHLDWGQVRVLGVIRPA